MHHLRGACWWFSKTQFSKKNIWFSATLSQSKQLGWIQVIWCNLETIFYILGLRWALFQHGRWTVLEKSKNRREQPWYGSYIFLYLIWNLRSVCLTVFDAYRHTLRLWRSQKTKFLSKTTFERQLMIRRLKLSKGTCLNFQLRRTWLKSALCADFLLHLKPNLYSINAAIVTVVLFHFRKFSRGTPSDGKAESIAFSEWCQNSNWHLVMLTCQEIKVQGSSWTFRYLCTEVDKSYKSQYCSELGNYQWGL